MTGKRLSKEEDIPFNLTIEKIKDSPIFDNLSEEFKKDLPLIIEDIKKIIVFYVN